MNIEKLAESIGLDSEEYLELIDLFVATAATDLGKIRSATGAGDAECAAAAAHSLKGASANLGLSDLSEAAQSIELKCNNGYMNEIAGDIQFLMEKLEEIATELVKERN